MKVIKFKDSDILLTDFKKIHFVMYDNKYLVFEIIYNDGKKDFIHTMDINKLKKALKKDLIDPASGIEELKIDFLKKEYEEKFLVEVMHNANYILYLFLVSSESSIYYGGCIYDAVKNTIDLFKRLELI